MPGSYILYSYFWTPGIGKLELWTSGHLDSRHLVTSISFLLLYNIGFLYILNGLQLMHFDSLDRAANGYYNSNLLQLRLSFKLSNEATTRS